MINNKSDFAAGLAIVLIAALAACSDPRAASKSNFEKAANAYYKRPGLDRSCFSLPQSDAMLMMFFGSNNEDKNAIVIRSGDRNEKRLDALAATAGNKRRQTCARKYSVVSLSINS